MVTQIAIIHSHIVCADSGSSPTMHNAKLQCVHILKHAWSFLPCCPLCIWFYRTWTHITHSIIPVRACILRICNCRHILISTHYTMHLRWWEKSFHSCHPWPLSRLWLALEHPAGNTVCGCTCGMLSSGASAASPMLWTVMAFCMMALARALSYTLQHDMVMCCYMATRSACMVSPSPQLLLTAACPLPLWASLA